MLRKSVWPACAMAVVFVLSGCETPERRMAMRRMDQLQAENSALKATTETEVAQSRVEIARQRQEDMRVIEALNRRFDELSRKLDAALNQPRVEAPRPSDPPAQSAKPVEPPRPDPAVQAELERAKAETRAQLARMEEELAKAQAQAEAAKLAAVAAEKRPQTGSKEGSFTGRKLPLTKFIDSSGKLVDLSSFAGKVVVLTVMKGFYSQGICVYCTRQTADFARNHKAFKDLEVEVLVVYPGREDQINSFVRSVRDYEKSEDPRFALPFKVLLDVNQDAVRALNIAGDLAHPTTFVLDKEGIVRYQYVGRTMSDRPTASDVLAQVNKIKNQ